MGLFLGGFISGRIFASEIWGLIFSGGIFGGGGGGGLLSEFYSISTNSNLANSNSLLTHAYMSVTVGRIKSLLKGVKKFDTLLIIA